MAVPAGVLVAVGELAMNPKVREFATNLVSDVYGKIMPSREAGDEDDRPHSIEDIAKRLDELPTRDELIASFSVLQAELEREQQRTRRWVFAVLAVQVLLVLSVATVLIAQ